jgi:hypothetical protein
MSKQDDQAQSTDDNCHIHRLWLTVAKVRSDEVPSTLPPSGWW